MIIEAATKIVELLYSEKRKSDNKGISKYKVFLSSLSIMIIIAFFVVMYFAILQENREFEYIAYGLIVAGLLIFSLLTVYESLRSSKSSVFKYKDVVSEEIGEFFEK